MPSDEEGLGLGALRVPRAADVLADIIRGKILDGELGPGTSLPSERDLAEESRLSRGSVRDALRMLELEGLVATRPGRNGGTVVRQVEADPLIRSLKIFIRGRGLRPRSLLEIRELVEPECAALAAERGDEAAIASLVEVCEQMREHMDDVDEFLTLNTEWHTRMAAASGNELLAAFMSAVAPEIREATDLSDFNSAEVVEAAQHAHETVIDAIRHRDPAAARRRMARHVHAYREAAWERVEGERR